MEKENAITALAALAQSTRLDIFRYLVSLGPDGSPVGQIGEHFDLPSATLSFHLRTLKQAGLVDYQRAGRSLIYTANFSTMKTLLAYLSQDCCGGHPEICQVPDWQTESST